MRDMSQAVHPLITQKKREARRYPVIEILTVVVAAAGGYIMLPKILLPSVDSTTLSTILLGIMGVVLGVLFGLLSHRKMQ